VQSATELREATEIERVNIEHLDIKTCSAESCERFTSGKA
jgi:hypothetical protein